MKFVIGAEDFLGWLDRATYKGAIGIFYNDTWSGVLAYILFGLIVILAVVGLIAILRLLFFRPRKTKPKAPSTDKWLKTGKW